MRSTREREREGVESTRILSVKAHLFVCCSLPKDTTKCRKALRFEINRLSLLNTARWSEGEE